MTRTRARAPIPTPLGTHEPTADKTPALAFAHRLWLSLTRHLRARLPRGRNPYYCFDYDYE